jgi:pimeloyl-ACP methyl ester carboxylesterase
MNAQPRAFALNVADTAITDLRERLARTRFPDQAPGEPWAYGTNVDYLRGLVEYWRTAFDWRAQEARLNAFAQFKAPLHDINVHFLHVPGKGPNPCPLLLMHGWPGSVFEFIDLIPRLTDPASFGGDPADAFTVVAPSLPGYGMSFRPGQKRFGIEEIADCLADLMTETLGYRRFAAQGGDWGGITASRMGYAHADKLIGIHVNLLAVRRDGSMLSDPTPEERKYLDELAYWLKEETGYQWIQGTRPQTLSFGLTDSPAGSRRGSSRSFAHGLTATGTWTACSRAIGCWRTSACTGSPARSVHRSFRITSACTDHGRSPKAAGSPCRRATASSRVKSSVHRGRWPSALTRTSAVGQSCRTAATSPRWNSRPRSLTTFGCSSGHCGSSRVSDAEDARRAAGSRTTLGHHPQIAVAVDPHNSACLD